MDKNGMDRSAVIGITVRRGDSEWVQKSTHNYLNVLTEYGATSVILAPDTPATLPGGATFHPDDKGQLPGGVLEHLDGIIFSGGGDVHPQYFGESLNGAEPEAIDLKRDELELSLGRAALAQDLPIFAICRGFQVLNVAAGGKLIQHLEGHRSTPTQTRFHDVMLVPKSRLHQITGQARILTNTFHHQGIDATMLAPPFVAAGFAAPDPWLVEAYESLRHRWVVGLQWHPERLFELDESHRRIWTSFVDACQERRSTPGVK